MGCARLWKANIGPDQQYADDISWITTNKNAKEYIKNTVSNALIDKNLLVNPEKTEEYSINRSSR